MIWDLGYQGEVNVRIKDEGNIKNGSLTLTREGSANTVTSALYVGDTLFTDLNQNVATFTEDNKDTSVALSFAAPEEPYIPAERIREPSTLKFLYPVIRRIEEHE